MSSDDKTYSSAKNAKSATAAGDGVKSPGKNTGSPHQAINVYKAMAANAAANGTKAPALSAKNKKLLDRQAVLLKTIAEHGVAGRARRLPSKSSIQDVAKRVGIWAPSGKLSSSYKK